MSTPTTTKQGNLMFLRVAITLQTLAVFAAPITAGLLLSSPGGRALHSVSAYGVFTVALLHLVAAILVWRPGGGSPRPILYALGFFGLTLAQIALGIAHVKTLHVPLGVLMFGVSVLQLSRVSAGRRTHVDAAA
jgi:heme A synthase